MFRVRREQLVSELWEFSKTESIVITGSPGVGKSWIIAQLIRRARSQNRPCLPIAAEDFDIASIDELSEALNFKTDLLSFLRGLGSAPMLIVDGLDALRGELSQKVFRELIRRVSREVLNCSIVASIRTFDLQQSEQLQQLFFSSWPGRSAAKRFSEVTIPPFTDEDLAAVVDQVPGIGPLLKSGGVEMKTLLRIPFNLHIAGALLESGIKPDELSALQSQVQLINKYWRIRIESASNSQGRTDLLRRTVEEMVEHKTLSIPDTAILRPQTAPVLQDLLSDEILREGVTNRVSFTHNILFDYASARLLLDEEKVFHFIRQDESRTIFYRPTLTFFFHYLWAQDRNLFWEVAMSFMAASDLPERATIVPSIVVQQAATRLDDVAHALDTSSDASKKFLTGLLRAVQTLGGLQTDRRSLWLETLQQLSKQPDLVFINEFMALLSIASEAASPSEGALLGSIAARMLTWMWATAEKLERPQAISLSDIAASRVFPILARFLNTNLDSGRKIIRTLLDRFELPNSGSHEIFWLAHEIIRIAEADPDLAIEVYRRSFAHEEASEESTNMGGSVVLRLTSTRKQDFSSGLYGLETGFPTFLNISPMKASTAAVLSVEGEMRREHSVQPDETNSFGFRYEDFEARYVSDHSEIWDSGFRQENSLKLLDSVLRSVVERLRNSPNDGTAISMFTSVVQNSSYAVIWKRIVEVAALNVHEMYPNVLPLLKVPAFVAAPEVTVAVGNLLKAAYESKLVTDSESLAIERSITYLTNTQVILRYEKPEQIRDRLLGCIPFKLLRSPEAKKLVAAVNPQTVRDNEPYHGITSGYGTFTPEDWLREQGVDTRTPENSKLIAALKPLQEFEHKYLNEVPDPGVAERVESLLKTAENLLQQQTVADPLNEQAVGTMCAVAESVLKNGKLGLDSSIVQLCKRIVIAGAKHPAPEFNPKYHETFDMPSWGSPLPRIEAAQGLTHFVWNWGADQEVMSLLDNLSRDRVPAVRFQIASGLLGLYVQKQHQQFWSLLEKMLVNEKTTGVMIAIVGTLGRIAPSEPDRVMQLLSPAIDRGLPASDRHELIHGVVQILVGLFVAKDNASANTQLLRFENDPIKFHRELSEAVTTVSYYLYPQNVPETGTRQRARQILERVLIAAYTTLEKIRNDPPSEDKAQALNGLLGLQDEVATRVHFALGNSPQAVVDKPAMGDEDHKTLFRELQPILELLTTRRTMPAPHYLLPHSAHYLMQTMNAVLAFDPAAVIGYASAVCSASVALNYPFDSLAVSEVVKFVEHVLADHKDVLRDTSAANALGAILDIFVKAGWPQALQLTFTLDRAIR